MYRVYVKERVAQEAMEHGSFPCGRRSFYSHDSDVGLRCTPAVTAVASVNGHGGGGNTNNTGNNIGSNIGNKVSKNIDNNKLGNNTGDIIGSNTGDITGNKVGNNIDIRARDNNPPRRDVTGIPGKSGSRHRKLILHMDVRNTILVADSVTNVSVEQALNSFLTGVTWGQPAPSGEWEWSSEEPSLTSPAPNAMTYYKHMESQLVRSPSDRVLLRDVTGDFTQQPIGSKFQSHFKDHLRYLEWPFGGGHDPSLTMAGKDGTRYHYILPAFYKLIHHLHRARRDFAIVIRTYGMDAPNVMTSMALALRGQHPQFPNPLPIHVNVNCGKISRTKSEIRLETPPDTSDTIPPPPPSCITSHCKGGSDAAKSMTLSDEREIYDWFSTRSGVCALVDDFRYWQEHDYHHACAKPLWVDPTDEAVHHIFFDDNIRVTDVDSIVDLRELASPSSASTSVADSVAITDISRFEDMCLVQADLLESTSNADYFIEQVAKCEKNYSAFLTSLDASER